MKKLITFIAFVIPFLSISQIINVPSDYSTIQEGINAADTGDTILVADGIYYENINFNGKAITLASHFLIDGNKTHIDSTIIDGSRKINPDSAYVVYFVNHEDSTSILTGFTLKYKAGSTDKTGKRIGGVVFIYNAQPKIQHNKIEEHNYISEFGRKARTYISWISLNNISQKKRGCLYQVNDSSLALIPGTILKQGYYEDWEYELYKGDQINKIKIRRKGSILKGALFGALAGLTAGAILGIVEGDDEPSSTWDIINYTAGQKAIMYGAFFIIPGAAIGAALGSIKINIPINSSMETYHQKRKKLRKYSVKK